MFTLITLLAKAALYKKQTAKVRTLEVWFAYENQDGQAEYAFAINGKRFDYTVYI